MAHKRHLPLEGMQITFKLQSDNKILYKLNLFSLLFLTLYSILDTYSFIIVISLNISSFYVFQFIIFNLRDRETFTRKNDFCLQRPRIRNGR